MNKVTGIRSVLALAHLSCRSIDQLGAIDFEPRNPRVTRGVNDATLLKHAKAAHMYTRRHRSRIFEGMLIQKLLDQKNSEDKVRRTYIINNGHLRISQPSLVDSDA